MSKSMVLCLFTGLLWMSSSIAKSVDATDYRISYEGRVSKDWSSKSANFSWPGTSLQFDFYGKKLAIELDGRGTQFDVIVNGAIHSILKTTVGVKSYQLLDFSESQQVQIRLVKRNENNDAMLSIKRFISDGDLLESWRKQSHILFFGDSITAGYGNESDKLECTVANVENTTNARLSYASLIADKLSASRTLVAYSGLGVIRNWNGSEPHHNLPYYWNKTGSIYNGIEDFEDTYPNLIVINLGTNDYVMPLNHGEQWPDMASFNSDWLRTYIEFVMALLERYGDVPILIMANEMYNNNAKQVVVELHNSGLSNVILHEYSAGNYSGCNSHPSLIEHEALADAVLATIGKSELAAYLFVQ